MWRQNLRLAFRNFRRNKTTSLINAIGLSTSLACVFLIGLWVTDEYRVDRFHDEQGTVYQVMQHINRNTNDILTWEWTPGVLAQSLKEEYPEVEQAIHLTELGGYGIIEHNEAFYQATEYYADAGFFDLFAFPLLQGDPRAVLRHNNQVVISNELAEKLFPNTTNVVGETIEWKRSWGNVSGTYEISGVFQDMGSQSTLDFDLLFAYPLYFENKPNLASWRNSDPYTFLRLKAGTDEAAFAEKISDLIQRKEPESSNTLFLRAFADRYLFSDYENGVQAGGRITYVRILSVVALLVLLIACINFMNLSTAQASLRQKEVAMKKIVGVRKSSLVGQFLAETFLFTTVCAALALIIVQGALPFFNTLAEKELQLMADPTLWGLLALVIGGAALLAGSYPAFYLSNLSTMHLLGQPRQSRYTLGWLRKGLVTIQFALSIFLILGMLVIYQQLDFLADKPLGYNQENVLLFRKEGALRENPTAFMQELEKIAGVQSVSTLDNNMTGSYGYTTSVSWAGKDPSTEPLRFGVMTAGEQLIETLGMKMQQGRSFAGHFQAPGRQVILNEAAVAAIGYSEPIGKTIERRGEHYEIVGVVEDFHFESLYEAVKPCIIERSANGRQVVMKVNADQTPAVIAGLEELHAKMNPAYPLEYQFLDEQYRRLYASEDRIAVLTRCFAGLAILLSCLGAFGLMAFTVEKRAKEISIRKILGASVSGIMGMLSKELVGLLLLAALLASPLAYWLMQNWLSGFAYHTQIQWWMFVLAGGLALGLALFTVAYQSIKAALANPVDAIKND